MPKKNKTSHIINSGCEVLESKQKVLYVVSKIYKLLIEGNFCNNLSVYNTNIFLCAFETFSTLYNYTLGDLFLSHY